MLRNTLFVLCVVCAALLIGCHKSGTTSDSNSNNSNTVASSNSATSTTGTSSSATTDSGEKIGIPECDKFLTAYDACITKHVPEAQRAAYESSLKQWRESWRKLAANPTTKGALVVACQQAAEQARTSMKTYGCNF